MKKISVVLLLTATYIASTACMMESEQLFYSQQNNTDAIWFPEQSIATHQPSWEQLDPIVNLNPIYHHKQEQRYYTPPKKPIKPQEKKHLLLTILMHPETQLIKNLYTTTRTSLLKDNFCLPELINLIAVINYAKKNNTITEDCMGKYAYNKGIDKSPATILFFSYLKRYNLTIKDTKECLPCVANITKKKYIHKKAYPICLDENLLRSQYPAFNVLQDRLNRSIQLECFNGYDSLFSYVYSNEKIALEDYSHYSYADLKNTFYNKAYVFFVAYAHQGNKCEDIINTDDVFNLLPISEVIKTLYSHEKMVDFYYNIFEHEKTIVNKFFALSHMTSPIPTKNRIYLFYQLVEQYNKNRQTKRTPTIEQYYAYKTYNEYGHCTPYSFTESTIALPDFFDSTLLDDNYYAFKEFKILLDDIKELIETEDSIIQNCVDKLYLQKDI